MKMMLANLLQSGPLPHYFLILKSKLTVVNSKLRWVTPIEHDSEDLIESSFEYFISG